MPKYLRHDILGCPIDAIDFEQTVAEIRDAVTARKRLRIAIINVDQVMKARRDASFAQVLRQSELAVSDGVPVVWAARLSGTPIRGRVSGTDLVWHCVRVSAETGRPIALIGAAPGVAARAADVLRRAYAGARLHALPTPFPLGERDSEELSAQIRSLDAGIVLAALGAPRQERWIHRYLDACGAAVGIGIGSALDIISGDQPRAPAWMSDHGLEWAHRMRLDPRRLSRRYLIEDSPFFLELARSILSSRVKHSGSTF